MEILKIIYLFLIRTRFAAANLAVIRPSAKKNLVTHVLDQGSATF